MQYLPLRKAFYLIGTAQLGRSNLLEILAILENLSVMTQWEQWWFPRKMHHQKEYSFRMPNRRSCRLKDFGPSVFYELDGPFRSKCEEDSSHISSSPLYKVLVRQARVMYQELTSINSKGSDRSSNVQISGWGTWILTTEPPCNHVDDMISAPLWSILGT